jgi:hypothetical protein
MGFTRTRSVSPKPFTRRNTDYYLIYVLMFLAIVALAQHNDLHLHKCMSFM